MFELRSITLRVRLFPLGNKERNNIWVGCSKDRLFKEDNLWILFTRDGYTGRKARGRPGKSYRESSRQGEIMCLRGLKFCGPQDVSSCKDQCSPSSHTWQTSWPAHQQSCSMTHEIPLYHMGTSLWHNFHAHRTVLCFTTSSWMSLQCNNANELLPVAWLLITSLWTHLHQAALWSGPLFLFPRHFLFYF